MKNSLKELILTVRVKEMRLTGQVLLPKKFTVRCSSLIPKRIVNFSLHLPLERLFSIFEW